MSYLLVILETILEMESLVFLVHDFGVGPFWRVFLPLGAHLVAMVLLMIGFLGRWDYTKGRDRAWAVTALSLTLPLPLFGFLGFVALYALFHSRPRGTGDLLKDFEEYITYDSDDAGSIRDRRDPESFIMDEVDVAPLRDILAGSDVALKRGAILSLSRLPRREAVILLKSALADESREIRYYAGNALSDMEMEFNDRIYRLVREVERSPTRIEYHIDLARIVLDYMDTGLLDESMAGHFGEIGLRALDKASMVGADDRRINLYMGLLLQKLGRTKEAEAALRKYVETSPEDADAMLTLAEITYELGVIDSTRSVVENGLERFPEDQRFKDLKLVLG
ncbi:MAG: hypothetical protein GXP54_07745 [Deltaproteobacteria bacterium]|nr:hypothetical protein [Deltaproteobacteria bacterium]